MSPMPDPVRAWDAVAPDGTMNPDRIKRTASAAWATIYGAPINAAERQVLRDDGWRVVPIEIVPMENRNE